MLRNEFFNSVLNVFFEFLFVSRIFEDLFKYLEVYLFIDTVLCNVKVYVTGNVNHTVTDDLYLTFNKL